VVVGLVLLAGAALLLIAGAELFTDHAVAASRHLGVTALAIGIVLAGAEPEELITAVTAVARGRPGIAAGDAFGANVTMLTLVIGLAAVVRGVPVGGRVRRYAIGASGLAVAAALLARGGAVTPVEGWFLVALYVVAVVAVWRIEHDVPAVGELAEAMEEAEEAETEGRERPTMLHVVLVLAGVAVMASGGWLAVLGAERVVAAMGVADSAVGLTFVALATTAELLALVWSAGRRDLEELAVAGIVGSVAYNATVTLGLSAAVGTVTTAGVTTSAWIAAGLPLGILLLGGRGHRIGRVAGALLLVGYAVYVTLLLT
jgi:cation:H+ antiporter